MLGCNFLPPFPPISGLMQWILCGNGGAIVWVRTSRSRNVASSLIRNNLVRRWLVTCWPDNVTRNQSGHDKSEQSETWNSSPREQMGPQGTNGSSVYADSWRKSRAESLTGDPYWLSLIWPSGSRGAARLSSGKCSFLANFGAQRLISNPRNCRLHIKPPWVLGALTCSPSKADANVSNSTVPR